MLYANPTVCGVRASAGEYLAELAQELHMHLELLRAYRLDQEIVSAGLESGDLVMDAAPSCDDHQEHVTGRRGLPKGREQLDARGVGQV